jgi:acetyl-CoA C-acetyltransferase
LTTALGWYVTKHAAGVWSNRPPADTFRRVDPHATQRRVDALPRRTAAGLVEGDVVVEATSVAFERDGTPGSGIVTACLDGDRRAIAVCREAGQLRAFTEEPWEGRRVRVANRDGVNEVVG